MFNIGMMELILVLLVAFLIVGPKDLPKVARWIAKQLKSIRKMVRELKKEAGWDEITAEFRDTKSDLESTIKQADVSAELKQADVSAELRQAAHDVRKSLNDVKKGIEDNTKL